MFRSGPRASKSRPAEEQKAQKPSPFPTHLTSLLSSPIAARRSAVEGYRRPVVDFHHDVTPGRESKVDEDQDARGGGQESEQEEDEELDEATGEDVDDEDGDEEATPLLPIFSAAHLGILSFGILENARVP